MKIYCYSAMIDESATVFKSRISVINAVIFSRLQCRSATCGQYKKTLLPDIRRSINIAAKEDYDGNI